MDKLGSRMQNPVMLKISKAVRRAVLREMQSAGGKARAAKYDKATLTKWAKMGGRPPKAARLGREGHSK